MSPAELAARCRMPRSRVSDLLAGKRRITPDTAVRLAALFRMEPESWLALQAPWDLHQTPLDAEVVPLDPPGFLIGPLGATPLSVRRAPAAPSSSSYRPRPTTHPKFANAPCTERYATSTARERSLLVMNELG
jgi:addiction module HigA family antidote